MPLKKKRRSQEKKQCDVCGGMYHNIGTHKNMAHPQPTTELRFGENGELYQDNEKEGNNRLVVDKYVDEPLSTLLSDMEKLLKAYRTETEIKIEKNCGSVKAVEIKTRILLR